MLKKIPPRKFLAAAYLLIFILLIFLFYDQTQEIRLIVRGDDMGFSHAVNVGCIKSYREGILSAVEVMVPGPALDEAVTMLRNNPGLDVGIHLTLNSEWENIKWGPLTNSPSLVGADGFFFPMTWPDAAYPNDRALGTASWKIDEIEQELRAQIEKILIQIPWCSHATPHMGFNEISPQVHTLVLRLMREYNIDDNISFFPRRQLYLFGDAHTENEMVANALTRLEGLGQGIWEFYDHPGMIGDGFTGAWHIGAEYDSLYRARVTRVLTNPVLKEVIERRNIRLVGYRDL